MKDKELAPIARTAPVQLWTVKETADYLGVPVSSLYYWSFRGEGGPPILRIGRCLRYNPERVQAWVESQAA